MYKIEITADTLAELAGKAAALAAKLNTGTATERPIGAAPELGMGYHQKIETPFIPLDPVMPEVAEMATAPEHANEATEAPSAPDTLPESGTPTSGTGPTAETASPTELDFDTDVAPYVLQVVKEKGKPVAQEILSQFGVEKASSLDPAQWPELVATLKAAL